MNATAIKQPTRPLVPATPADLTRCQMRRQLKRTTMLWMADRRRLHAAERVLGQLITEIDALPGGWVHTILMRQLPAMDEARRIVALVRMGELDDANSL